METIKGQNESSRDDRHNPQGPADLQPFCGSAFDMSDKVVRNFETSDDSEGHSQPFQQAENTLGPISTPEHPAEKSSDQSEQCPGSNHGQQNSGSSPVIRAISED
jgi:hypothetical protein